MFCYLDSLDFIILIEIKYKNAFGNKSQQYYTVESGTAERNELRYLFG